MGNEPEEQRQVYPMKTSPCSWGTQPNPRIGPSPCNFAYCRYPWFTRPSSQRFEEEDEATALEWNIIHDPPSFDLDSFKSSSFSIVKGSPFWNNSFLMNIPQIECTKWRHLKSFQRPLPLCSSSQLSNEKPISYWSVRYLKHIENSWYSKPSRISLLTLNPRPT